MADIFLFLMAAALGFVLTWALAHIIFPHSR
jgi:hypothetical protein